MKPRKLVAAKCHEQRYARISIVEDVEDQNIAKVSKGSGIRVEVVELRYLPTMNTASGLALTPEEFFSGYWL